MTNNSDLYIGDGLHDLEIDGRRHFRWATEFYYIYFNSDIKSITLEIFSDFKSECWYYNKDYKNTITVNSGFSKITITNLNFDRLKIHQNYFIPKNTNKNSNDSRKLSYRVYNIDILYTNGQIKRLSIKSV